MKKVLLIAVVLALISGAAFAQESAGEIKAKIGIQMFQKIKPEGYDSEDVNTGFSLGAEYLYPVHEIIKVGAGVEYWFDRKIDDNPANVKFSQIPLYATAQICFPELKELYFKANLGWAFAQTKSDYGNGSGNGFLWGLGAGYELPYNIFAEAMYTMSYPKNDETKLTVGGFGINIGYRFGL